MRNLLLLLALAALCVPCPAQIPNCVPKPPGLVSWWRAEGNGNDSIGTNNGALQNGVSYDTGMVGQSFKFVSGSNPRIYIPDNPSLASLTNSLTIEGWIKANFGYNLLSRGDDRPSLDPFLLGFTSLNSLVPRFVIFDQNGQGMVMEAPAPIPASTWLHIAATLDGATGNAFIYINGQIVAQTNTVLRPAGPLPGGHPSLCIGNGPGLTGFPFDGWIDEISLYSRALSQAEIQGVYLAGSAGKCTSDAPVINSQPQGQVGYWGRNVTFTVGAAGPPPLSYLWYKDGFAITWATNSNLVLTNVSLTDGGNYYVVVSNPFGSVTSSNAYLTVNPAGISLGLYAGLTIEGAVSNTYGIQYATNVSPTAYWTTLTQITLTQPVQLWVDTNVNVAAPGNPQRFYRVVAIP